MILGENVSRAQKNNKKYKRGQRLCITCTEDKDIREARRAMPARDGGIGVYMNGSDNDGDDIDGNDGDILIG